MKPYVFVLSFLFLLTSCTTQRKYTLIYSDCTIPISHPDSLEFSSITDALSYGNIRVDAGKAYNCPGNYRVMRKGKRIY